LIGIDEINNSVIKDILKYLFLLYVTFSILSLAAGIFPANLKQAVFVPVKKGNIALVMNYRPISILNNAFNISSSSSSSSSSSTRFRSIGLFRSPG
jgi:hypothetical protein